MTQKTREARKTVQETPVQEIRMVADRCPTLSLRVTKRSAHLNHIITIYPNLTLDTLDLLNGKIEAVLEAKAGGGSYTIESTDPATGLETDIPRFLINLPGPPRDPRHVPDATVAQAMQHGGYGAQLGYGAQPFAPPAVPGYGPIPIAVPPAAFNTPGVAIPQPHGTGQYTLPPDNTIPGWARGYAPEHQWKLYYESLQSSGRLPAGASMHSDSIADRYANTWQTQWAGSNAENAKLRERIEAIDKERRETEARYQKQLEEERVQRERDKHAGEMAALRTEIASLRDGGGIGRRRDIGDWFTIAAGLAPLAAPVFAYLSDRTKADTMMQAEMRKLESKQQENMLALMAPKKSDTDWPALIASVGAFAVPIFAKVMENSSPTAHAELIEMKNNSTMMQTKMLFDLIREFESEPEKPPWYPIAEALLKTFDRVGTQMAMKAGAAQQQQQPNANGRQQRPPPHLPGQTAEQDAAVWDHLASIDQKAAIQTKQVLDTIPVGQGFHTPQWRIILFNINARSEVQSIVPAMVRHLAELESFQMLPELLRNVFDDQSTLVRILNGLPVAAEDPAYVKHLAETLVGEIKRVTTTGETVPNTSAPINNNGGEPEDEEPSEEEYEDEDPDEDESDEDPDQVAAQ